MTTLFKIDTKEIEVKTGIMLSKSKELIAYFRPVSAKDNMNACFGRLQADVVMDMFIRFNEAFDIEVNGEKIKITNLRQLSDLPINDELAKMISNCITTINNSSVEQQAEAVEVLKK